MFAMLPMYERPELQEADQEYWHNIHRALAVRGIKSPEKLTRQMFEQKTWEMPEMVLSQTCGMPYKKFLRDRVHLVGTPDFGLAGCSEGYYCSYLVVRKDDARDTIDAFQSSIFAFNDENSQSGYAAAWNHLTPKGVWFTQFLETGAHLQSARAVADGRADIASIDAVTWRFAEEYEAFTDQLRILDVTMPTPGLPYITSKNYDPNLLFEAIEAAIALTDQEILSQLGIRNIVKIPEAEYLSVPNP